MRGIIAAAMLGIGVTGALAQPSGTQPMISQGSAVHLPDTGTAMASSATTALGNRIGLWKCVTGATITCYGVYVREQAGGPAQYTWSSEWWSRFRLADNFRVEHHAVRGYYVNGRGQSQVKADLGQGDAIWYAVEFADGTDNITKAYMFLPNDRGNGRLGLTAPVGKTLD